MTRMDWREAVELGVKVLDLLLALWFIADFVFRITGHGGLGGSHGSEHGVGGGHR